MEQPLLAVSPVGGNIPVTLEQISFFSFLQLKCYGSLSHIGRLVLVEMQKPNGNVREPFPGWMTKMSSYPQLPLARCYTFLYHNDCNENIKRRENQRVRPSSVFINTMFILNPERCAAIMMDQDSMRYHLRRQR